MDRVYILWAAMGLLSSSAIAANLPEHVGTPLAPPVPVFRWAGAYTRCGGAYIGVNTGYGGSGSGDNYPFSIASGGRSITTANSALVTSGPLGGGQVGYNFAVPNVGLPYRGSIVGGLEADYDAANIGGNARPIGNSPLGAAGAGQGSIGTTTSSLGTVRGRLGASFGRIFLFGTGGFAFAQASSKTSATVGGLGAFSQSSQTTHDGVVFGGGAEYLLTEHLTAKIEYLRANFDTRQITSGAAAARSFSTGERPSEEVVRVGLNFKVNSFGVPAIPVVAPD